MNKSIALNPNNSEAYAYLAYTQIELGMFKEAELNANKSVQLDPVSGLTRGVWFNLYLYSRKPNKLLDFIKDQPVNEQYMLLADRKRWYYFLKDDYDSILINNNARRDPVLTGIAYAKTGRPQEAGKIVDSLKALSLLDHAFDIGIIYAWMGEKQKAMDYLLLAYRLYDYNLVKIKVDKLFDPLRNETAFRELLVKMGLE